MANVDATASLYEQLAPSRRADAAGGDLGQADFLKLMTTQLRSQDPFSPMENGEFLGQIAQFGTVSGIQELQDSFGNLSNALRSNQALQASVLVGKQVLVSAGEAELGTAAPLRGAVELPSPVAELHVRIEGANGALLRELALGPQPAGLVEFDWDGELAAGGTAAPGLYRVRAETMIGGDAQALPVLAAANVNSVTLGAGATQPQLDLGALGQVALGDVRRIS